MKTAPESDPTEVESLTQQVQELQQKLDQQSQFIDSLLEQIRLARHQRFGSSSEQFDGDQQMSLFNEAEAIVESDDTSSEGEGDLTDQDEPTVSDTSSKKRKGGRRRLPAHFLRVEVIHTLDEGACQCAHCLCTLEPMGEKVSEQLDIIPASIQVIRHVRKTYRCPDCDSSIKTVPMPAQPIPGSIATPGTLAHVVTNKYVDGLPLYRQEQGLKRLELELSRSTLAHWMVQAGSLIQPLINLLRDTMLDYDIIGMDETRVQVLKEPGKSPQSQSYMWVQRGGPPDNVVILFDYDPTRSQQVPVRLLPDYRGYLQTDGYDGYNLVCKENSIIQVGCWAHVRRKFDEALKAQGPHKNRKASLAAIGLQRIQLLYGIERKAKSLTPKQRYALRQSRSVPILTDLRQWLGSHLPVVVKQSAVGKAMYYLHNQWDKLMIYTQDGRLRMDNNLTENAIRPFVIGRKNHLFSETVAGAKASANLYSLIETAKANGIEPYHYLKTVFTEIPNAQAVEDFEALLPSNQKTKLDQAA